MRPGIIPRMGSHGDKILDGICNCTSFKIGPVIGTGINERVNTKELRIKTWKLTMFCSCNRIWDMICDGKWDEDGT